MYRVTISSIQEAKQLDVFDDDDRFDFWSKHRVFSKPIDVMVSPSGQDEFESTLNNHNMEFEIMINNFEE